MTTQFELECAVMAASAYRARDDREARRVAGAATMPEGSEELRCLPDLGGMGRVGSLWQTMRAQGARGDHALKALVKRFAVESDRAARRALTLEIIYAWTEARAGATLSRKTKSRSAGKDRARGIGDARKLCAMEAFLGGVDDADMAGTAEGKGARAESVPQTLRTEAMLAGFEAFAQGIEAQLLQQTLLAELYGAIRNRWGDARQGSVGDLSGDLSGVVPLIVGKLIADSEAGRSTLADFVASLERANETVYLETSVCPDSLAALGRDIARAAKQALRERQALTRHDTPAGNDDEELI